MKIVSLFVLFISVNLHGQNYFISNYLITFEDSTTNNKVYFGSLTNNIWQIGRTHKSVLNSSYSGENVIITDTLNSYPVTDTSRFYIYHPTGSGFEIGYTVILQGYYKVDCDSLNDFGKIEFSPDKGLTWVELNNETVTEHNFESIVPVLTGLSDWEPFYFQLNGYRDIYPVEDTVIFRFSFISDSIDNHRDGLMFDNIQMSDQAESIESKSAFTFVSRVFPNPSRGIVELAFDNKECHEHLLKLFNAEGRLVIRKDNIYSDKVKIDLGNLLPGVYFYYLFNRYNSRNSNGKIVVSIDQ